ncbi:MAG: hypothetical protein LEGION0398_MBIBDBAK_00023 [Legionellaceae bacterium]
MGRQSTTNVSHYLEKTNHVADSIEFTGILGSAVNSAWFETLMKYAGTYLFTFALIFNVIKLGFSIYNFFYSRNKNAREAASLLWTMLQVSLIAVAVIGILVASTTFAVITPILFFTAIAADALRNIALLAWNFFQFIRLAILIGQEKNNNLIAGLQYTELKNKYLANMRQHFIGSVVLLAVATAILFIFVFPHIGLGAVSATIVTVGALNISVAGLTGVIAGISLIGSLMPLIWQTFQKACNYLYNSLYSVKIKYQPVKDNDESNKIDTQEKLENLSNATLHFNAFMYQSNHRELLIKNISYKKPTLALKALIEMLDQKIKSIDDQMKASQHTFFTFTQTYRYEKLEALKKIKDFLENGVTEDNLGSKITTFDGLIDFIERQYPNIQQSFFKEESDTGNLLKALKCYAEKFNLTQKSISEDSSESITEAKPSFN